jgi:cyclic-di-GMP-binding protein
MADKHSFDIVAKLDLQVLDNAINQALREIKNRYDLKDSGTTIEYNVKENSLEFESENDYKLNSSKEIFNMHLIRFEVSPKAFDYKTPEKATGERIRQQANVQQGIPQEKAKDIVKHIKSLNLKVQVQITGDSLRVSGKKIDDLQSAMKGLREKEFDCAMSFVNLK